MTEVGNYLLTSGALFGTVFNGTTQYPTLQLTDQASQEVWKGFAQSALGSRSRRLRLRLRGPGAVRSRG